MIQYLAMGVDFFFFWHAFKYTVYKQFIRSKSCHQNNISIKLNRRESNLLLYLFLSVFSFLNLTVLWSMY